MNIKTVILIFCVACCKVGLAQNNAISFSSGYSYAFRHKAPGYGMELNYSRRISDRFQAGILIGHYYNDSRAHLPEDLSTIIIPFRDHTNPLPLAAYSGAWDKNSFPGIRLKSRPNRYFTFVSGVNTTYKLLNNLQKSNVIIHMGVAYALRDEMEIAYLKEATQIKLVNSPVFLDAKIPIYRYSTYGDWLIRFKVNYSYPIRQNLAIHAGYLHNFFIGERDAIGSILVCIEVKF